MVLVFKAQILKTLSIIESLKLEYLKLELTNRIGIDHVAYFGQFGAHTTCRKI